MPCCGVSLSSSNNLTSAPAEKQNQLVFIPKAICVIVMLGGVFFLLAALKVLPSMPNAISNLKGIGIAIGVFVILGGGAAFFCVVLKTKKKSVPLEKKDPPLSSHKEKFPPEKSTLTKKATEKEDPRLTERENELLSLSPKRIIDGRHYDETEIKNCRLKVIALNKALISVCEALGRENIIKSQEALQQIQSSLSQCIKDYEVLDKNGRYQITCQNSSKSRFATVIQDRNASAEALNQEIDDVKVNLLGKLDQFYKIKNLGVRNSPISEDKK